MNSNPSSVRVIGGLKITYETFPHTHQQLERLRILAITPREHEWVAAVEVAFAAEDQAFLIARGMYQRVMAKGPEKEGDGIVGTEERHV